MQTRCHKVMVEAQKVSQMADTINRAIKQVMAELCTILDNFLQKKAQGYDLKSCSKEVDKCHQKVKTYQSFFQMFDIINPTVLEEQMKQINSE